MAKEEKSLTRPEGTGKSAGEAKSEQTGPSPSGARVKILRVKSKSQRGFHRCGRHFTPQGVDIPLESLQPEQVKALQAEPQLTAEIVEQK